MFNNPPFQPTLCPLFFFCNPSLITRVSLIEWNIGTKRHGNNALSRVIHVVFMQFLGLVSPLL